MNANQNMGCPVQLQHCIGHHDFNLVTCSSLLYDMVVPFLLKNTIIEFKIILHSIILAGNQGNYIDITRDSTVNEIFGTWEKDKRRKEKVLDIISNILQWTLMCGTAEAINGIYMAVTANHTDPELLSLL